MNRNKSSSLLSVTLSLGAFLILASGCQGDTDSGGGGGAPASGGRSPGSGGDEGGGDGDAQGSGGNTTGGKSGQAPSGGMGGQGATGGDGSGGDGSGGGDDGGDGSGGDGSGGAPEPSPVSHIPRTGHQSCLYLDSEDATWKTDAGCSRVYTLGDSDAPFGQDAHYPDIHPARSYTGPVAPEGYPDDFITTDNVTGLVWRSCDAGVSGSNCDAGTATTFTFDEANDPTTGPCELLNDNTYAGRSDWRMPAPFEVLTLFDFETRQADATAFPQASETFWSAYEDPLNADQGFRSGLQLTARPKSNSYPARCVSGELKRHDYTPLADGTAGDASTQLLWNRCLVGQTFDGATCTGTGTPFNWVDAINVCEALTFASRSDWRLPNGLEAASLLDQTHSPSLDQSVFPSTYGIAWTSTGNPENSNSAFYTNSLSGSTNPNFHKASEIHVRCVTELE